jgi:hypothetical protein
MKARAAHEVEPTDGQSMDRGILPHRSSDQLANVGGRGASTWSLMPTWAQKPSGLQVMEVSPPVIVAGTSETGNSACRRNKKSYIGAL